MRPVLRSFLTLSALLATALTVCADAKLTLQDGDRVLLIGDVLIEGIRLCPPCTHLDKVTGQALLKPLADRGGLRADILSDGVIHVGDAISCITP